MATLYITEYAEIHYGAAGRISQIPMEPPLARQTVAISGSSAVSATLNSQTRVIRLHTDSVCSVEVGANPTAATTSGRMATNQTEYRGIPPGSSFQVAVVANT